MHAEVGPAIEYVCSKFGVDRSSRFSFTAQTRTDRHTVTDATDDPTPARRGRVAISTSWIEQK